MVGRDRLEQGSLRLQWDKPASQPAAQENLRNCFSQDSLEGRRSQAPYLVHSGPDGAAWDIHVHGWRVEVNPQDSVMSHKACAVSSIEIRGPSVAARDSLLKNMGLKIQPKSQLLGSHSESLPHL